MLKGLWSKEMPDKLISGGIRGMIDKLGRMSFELGRINLWDKSDESLS